MKSLFVAMLSLLTFVYSVPVTMDQRASSRRRYVPKSHVRFVMDHSSETNTETDNASQYLDNTREFVAAPTKLRNTMSYEVEVDGTRILTNLSHFWESTGLCPPLPHNESYKYFLSNDMRQNLAYIGAIPNSGIKYVRMHWLLDLVIVEKGTNQGPVYNFTYLDQLMDILQENGLFPGFELMGRPSDLFTDFEDERQILEWRDLVHQVAGRYISRYGLGNVMKWRFESWNEPDHHGLDGLNITVQAFLNYYDACSEGLRLADPSLTLGGPAASCRKPSFSKICWALLDHVSKGKGFFNIPPKLDFISFHVKGGKGTIGNSTSLLLDELNKTHKIWNLHPNLRNVPIVNDEADPLVGWSKPLQWRADSTYAAIVAKIIVQHQTVFKLHSILPTYSLLSNDNGFLPWNPNFFTQRTLLARFQINHTESGENSQIGSNFTQFIRKPVYDLMGLLSLMGDKQLQHQVSVNGHRVGELKSRFGVLASFHESIGSFSDSDQFTILLYNSDDTQSTWSNDPYSLRFKLPRSMNVSKELFYVKYSIDNSACNPVLWWNALDKPKEPTPVQLEMMRLQQCPRKSEGPQNLGAVREFNSILPLPGVAMFHICDKPIGSPDQVSSVRFINITQNQVLIVWTDGCTHSKCLKTFEVEYSVQKAGPYARINSLRDDITTIYVHTVTSPSYIMTSPESRSAIGWYRVRAVDYWERAGSYSLPVYYGS